MPFPITCAACRKTFSIADDVFERKVKGRVVTIKCKQCQAGIRVDGTKETPVFSVSDSVRPPAAAASRPPATGVARPPPVATKISAVAGERKVGPVKDPTEAPSAATPAAAVTKASAPSAIAASAHPTAPTLKSLVMLAAQTPLKAQPSPAAEAVRTAGAEPAARTTQSPVENLWAVDYPDGEDRELTLFEIERELAAGTIDETTLVWREGMNEWLELGQLPELGVLRGRRAPEPPVPAPRPPAPSASGVGAASELSMAPTPALPLPPPRAPAAQAPVIDFAQRNSKDAQAAPAPKPSLSTGRDLHASTPPTFATGLEPPVPSALAFPNAAPVTVPGPVAAAALARPAPMPLGAVAPIANVEDWPPRSRAPLLLGILVLLGAGGVVFYLARSSADKLPPLTPISALPPADQSARPPEPSAAPTAERAFGSAPGSGAALRPPDGPSLTSPNAGFAERFADGARSADQHGAKVTAPHFDAAAAKTALGSAVNQSAKCRERGGPKGKATVVVTFEPSGKVASAIVSDPPFAGTSSGACIAATMKHATVPAFSGVPSSVTKVISIQ